MSGESKHLRRQFSTEQMVAILRRHLVDKVPVSDLCDEYKLQPSVLYQWQRHLFENLAVAFEGAAGSGGSQRERQLAQKVEHLEAKLARKDSVIAEISSEYVQLRKDSPQLGVGHRTELSHYGATSYRLEEASSSCSHSMRVYYPSPSPGLWEGRKAGRPVGRGFPRLPQANPMLR
jgi:transposase